MLSIFAWSNAYARLLESARAAAFKGITGTLTAILLLLIIGFSTTANATAKTYYVSRNGNNKDGSSWTNAWNELDQIDWGKAAGATVYIDGGSSKMTYNTTLTVNATNGTFTTIKLGTDAGHNGQAVIQGSTSSPVGINLGKSTFVTITGTKSQGIVVKGHSSDGIYIAPGANFIILQELLVSNNRGAGVHLAGQEVTLQQSIINDNTTNVLMDQQPVAAYNQITTCWIYNSNYSYSSDGVYVNEPNNGITSLLTIAHSVLGPGLRNAVNYNANLGLTLSDSLLIDSTKNNVIAPQTWDSMTGITMFQTPLNSKGNAHSSFNLANPPTNAGINRTIVYGGTVTVAAGKKSNNYQNTQFATKGNTTYLSSTETDPLFVTDVSSYSNSVAIQTLINTDFSLKPGSPAQGTGSSVTSVSKLLSQM